MLKLVEDMPCAQVHSIAVELAAYYTAGVISDFCPVYFAKTVEKIMTWPFCRIVKARDKMNEDQSLTKKYSEVRSI